MLTRLALLVLVASTAHAAAPLEAYGRLPAVEGAALSPDGTRLALEETVNESHFVAVVALATDTLVAGIPLGKAKIRAVEWADDTHLLFTTATTETPYDVVGSKREWNRLLVYDIAAKKLQGLLDHVHDATSMTMNSVYGRPIVQRKDGETLVFVHGLQAESASLLPGLFRINLKSGAERLLKRGGYETRDWIVDDNGEVTAEQDYFDADRRWAIRLFRNGKVRQTVAGIAPIDAPDLIGLSADGSAVLVAVREETGVAWRFLSLDSGAWGADLAASESASEVLHADGSQRILGTAYLGDTVAYHFVSPELQESWNWVTRSFRHDRVELESVSADRSRMIVKVFGPESGYAFYLADLKEHYTRLVGSVYSGVSEIADVRKITYPAADGLKIPGYLTLPPGRAPEKLALVAFPHGGPEARDRLRFDWWAQAMAAQGYAVLQPNYRGSDLDDQWIKAGYGEWGKKMQSDVSDGVRYLVSEGIVDPARVCIVGASYGGYAALAGVTLESGVYRCAVAVAGVSDPGRMLAQESRSSIGMVVRYWNRFMGVDGPSDKRLDAISPLKHAENISVPVLLIHGKEDVTVPYDQSETMAKAMKRAGKPFEFVTLAGEDHYLSMSPTRLQMLQASMEFLRKHNPPD